jgi:hypothetical protein
MIDRDQLRDRKQAVASALEDVRFAHIYFSLH